MYILVLFLPLLSAIISGLFGRKIGTKGAGILTSSCIVISLIISCCIFYEIILNSSVTFIKLWKWFDLELLITNFELQFDSLTSIMLIVITSVSALVHIYSGPRFPIIGLSGLGAPKSKILFLNFTGDIV